MNVTGKIQRLTGRKKKSKAEGKIFERQLGEGDLSMHLFPGAPGMWQSRQSRESSTLCVVISDLFAEAPAGGHNPSIVTTLVPGLSL